MRFAAADLHAVMFAEIWYAFPKQSGKKRNGPTGANTPFSGMPRIERHGDVKSGPSFETDAPGSYGGVWSGSFGTGFEEG